MYKNNMIVVPFVIEPKNITQHLPYVSNNDYDMRICFGLNQTGLSLLFDTGAYGEFDIIISKKIADSITDKSFTISNKTVSVDRISDKNKIGK